eukprot:986258-Pleurochrysis_carterae.AAC.1
MERCHALHRKMPRRAVAGDARDGDAGGEHGGGEHGGDAARGPDSTTSSRRAPDARAFEDEGAPACLAPTLSSAARSVESEAARCAW